MTIHGREKIVLLGMMGRLRVGGGVWQTIHYLIGLRRLGYDPYYVEAHGSLLWAFQENEAEAAAFLSSIMHRFDLADRWAFHARSGSGSYYGMSEYQVNQLYETAAVILNLHGGTVPTPEQSASGRLVYIDTDPVIIQVELHNGFQPALDLLEPHCALFTFGENYGKSDCRLPVSDRFPFKPTRQPVVLDFWNSYGVSTGNAFTTVGNWKQLRRVVEYEGDEYYWSKHFEFKKVIDLPTRTNQEFELALSGCDDEGRSLLGSHGWRFRDAFSFTHDLDAYREYVLQSKAEFTVAKDQNIRFRTGWFSDRSATYLAASRPVITQETGFSNIFPTGAGLFGFSTLDDAVAATESINADYERHRRAAGSIAREYFSHDVVLTQLLSDVGITTHSRAARHSTPDEISVNVVGDLGSYTGMKTTVEGYVRALESTGVHVNLIDVSRMSTDAVTAGTTRINLICCEIASHFALWCRLGRDLFRDHYNVGIWLWESPTFPREWYDRFAYYDEIWAPTSFVASAISAISPIPVVRMPFVLEPSLSGSRLDGRRRLRLGDDEFTCLFLFNFYSSTERKNPMAVIECFKKAFASNEPARLIIKSTNADFNRDHFVEMNRNAEGHPISVYDGAWSPQEIADLTAACDCYVSLHRAEGVGVPISDAMAAGKPVVATGWSGNMDFMTISNSFPVSFRLMELDHDVGHYRAGDIWAEPSIEHASEMLRYVFRHREEAERRGAMARMDIQAAYSTNAVGALVRRRLDIIANRQRFQSLKMCVMENSVSADDLANQFQDLGEYVPVNQIRYEQLKKDLREIVQSHVPRSATLAVVSKGDDELLKLHDDRAWHFPQDSNFQYAGYYPKDSTEAIEQLEALRAKGGQFLLFPKTAFWWLEHYGEFREHLLTRYKVAHRDESCVMFELRGALP